ncbi:hypothetical protein [Agrobacterium tumefaciens]|uniref:hypothetical protein n=1 Tax=Agrobacterium tumefaciens TaxID=358 RepID=UPI002243D9E1|nr:hypothetical protein [Agrobacterium tumefaciens]MCW8059644.1 hypothetical protein [Agrobacterium tumefaciens]MCW8146254.1 hypothetical protein [Agrobacterium tumefaciens]
MENGSADGPAKRKADASNRDGPTRPSGPIKRLKLSASGRDVGPTGQLENSILESIEHDPDVDLPENIVFDNDGDDERELSWSPSPDRAPAARQIDRSGPTSKREGERAVSEHTASPFVPLPAREPTPVNTLHNYFDGSASGLNAGEVKGKSAKDKGKKKQPGPRRTMHNYYRGSHDGVVLISDLEQLRKVARLGTGAKEVAFRTKGQFERDFGKPPTSADMDDTCTITSFEPGIFRSKPRTWNTIEVEKREDWRDEYQERDWKFAGLMSKVGQSGKPFKERVVTGLLSENIGKFQTPVGERRRNHAYIEALKAGQYNPDALIRLEDGTYKAIFLKLYEGTRDMVSFKAVTDKYGENNVWLKTADFDYMTRDQFNKNAPTFDAAEKIFCEYTGRTYEPNVFVRSSEGKWISKKRYDEKNRNNFDEDMTELEILILGDHNQGFLQPKTMKWLNPELYEQRMRAAHLTGYVPTSTSRASSRGAVKMEAISDILANKNNRSSAPILMQISRDELESIDKIPPGAEHHQIYPQNVSEKSGYTGNYTRNWRSIRREEKFRDAASNQSESYFGPSSALQKPKRLMTDEQRRIVKTPSPSPVQSEVSEDELFVRQSSVSLPPDTSDDDETQSISVSRKRRFSSLPPDSSDDEPKALSRRSVERPSSARSDGGSSRPSTMMQQPSIPHVNPVGGRGETNGSPVMARRLAQAPQFAWLSASSDDESPVTVNRASLHSPYGDQTKGDVRRGTSADTITRQASQSPPFDNGRSRSRDVSRG